MKIRTYLAETLDGMAKGLFASLIVGVIIKQIGLLTGIDFLVRLGQIAQYFMGPCIGAGVAIKRNCGTYTILASMIAGAFGAQTVMAGEAYYSIALGEPSGAFLAALCGIEIGKKLEGKTKFDLLIVPAAVILIGGLVGVSVSPIISSFMSYIGKVINEFTLMQPIPMGILLGVVVGMILTLPISSAALCIAIGIDGIAAGAALAGCSAQMIGFAVASFKENKLSGLVSQGLGTSMLQVPNIIKNPWIWFAPTVSGGICGVLTTTIFKMETTSVGAGMGTSGLVGQVTTYSVMGADSLVPMLILHFIIPAVISLILTEFLRKKGLIKFGDMLL